VKDTEWTELVQEWIPKASSGGHSKVFRVMTPVSVL